jgi:hypothetical protein
VTHISCVQKASLANYIFPCLGFNESELEDVLAEGKRPETYFLFLFLNINPHTSITIDKNELQRNGCYRVKCLFQSFSNNSLHNAF